MRILLPAPSSSRSRRPTRPALCRRCSARARRARSTALFKFARALDFALVLLVLGGATALALVLRSAAVELRARLYRILAGLARRSRHRRDPLHRAPGSGRRRIRTYRRRSTGTRSTRCSRRISARRSSSSWPSRRSWRPSHSSRDRPETRRSGALTLIPARLPAADPVGRGPCPNERHARLRRRPDPHGGGVDLGRRARVHDSGSAPRRRRPLAARVARCASLLDARRRSPSSRSWPPERCAAPRSSFRPARPPATGLGRSGTGSCTRPTASCCSRRSRSSCRCSPSGPTTTASRSRGSASRSRRSSSNGVS